MSGWRLLDMGAADAAYNMAVDAALLRGQGSSSPPTLRLYRWSRPAVTLGYGLPADGAVNVVGCAEARVDVARRLTGGGVVVHDGAATFSIVASRAHDGLPATSPGLHRFAMELARSALVGVGVDARHADGALAVAADSPNWCLARAYCHDLLAAGGKMAGGADRRTSRGVLYQGYVRAWRPSAATLAAAYPRGETPLPVDQGPSMDEDKVRAGIATAFASRVGAVRPAQLTSRERTAARSIAETFARRTWVSGQRSEIRRLRREVELAATPQS